MGHVPSILREADRVGCDCPLDECGRMAVNHLRAGALTVPVARTRHSPQENHMTRKTLLTLTVLTALSAGTAFAATQSDTAAAKPTRASLDANSDGSIDRAEAAKSPRLLERFDAIDTNKDGKLSKEEMPRRGDHAGKRGPRDGGPREAMAKLDADKDGRISRAESAAGEGRFATRFDEMDANKDGYVDRTDHELRSKQRKDEWFASADTNKDGQLSRAEVDAAKPKHDGRGGDRPAATPSK